MDQLLAERNSQRSIVRATGVSRRTIAGRLKKSPGSPPCWPRLRPRKGAKKRWPALESDEIWTFVGAREQNVWLWLAVERESRRIGAWVPGDRSRATARRLWQQLPAHWRGPRCWYFTDLWESYADVSPRWQPRRSPTGSGGTSLVEAINCALRQRCGVLVRNSCSFSKCIRMHIARIKFVIERQN